MIARRLLLCFAVSALFVQPAQAQDLEEANRLERLANDLNRQGKTPEALAAARQVLEIREKALGAEHIGTAVAANDVGYLLRLQGNYKDARTYLERAYAIRKKSLGENHAYTLLSLQNLAAVLRDQGDFKAAKPLFEQVLAVHRELRGEESRETALAVYNLAMLLHAQGDYAAARATYEKALALNRRLYGENHQETSAAHSGLGLVCEEMMDFPAARTHFEAGLAISRRVKGEEHTETASSWNNLGGLLGHQGDYAGARVCYDKALAIRRKIQGDHRDTSVVLNNIGWVITSQGDYAAGYDYYQQSLEMAKKVLGPEHPTLAGTYNGMAWAKKELEDFAAASQLYEEALRVHRQTYGEQTLLSAVILSNLGEVRREQGKFDEARELYDQSLTIRRAALGKNHPEVTGLLRNLAILESVRGKWDAAAEAADQSRRIVRQHVAHVLPALTYREQLTFLKESDERSLHRVLSIGLTRAADPQWVALSASWLINGKGTTQEAVAAQTLIARDSNDPKLKGAVDQRNAVRRELAMLTLTTPKADRLKEHAAQLAALEADDERLTRSLADLAGRPAESVWVETDAIRKTLNADATLVNFGRFRLYDVLEKERSKRWQTTHYVAWIIPPAGRGDVQIVDLGPAEPIDAAVAKAREAVTSAAKEGGALEKDGEVAAEKAAAAELQRAADLVWKPLAGKVADAKRLILSPDGALWLLPWSALPVADGKCLLERFAIHYVISGREILRRPQADLPTTPPKVFADPDFDLGLLGKREALKGVFPGNPEFGREATRGLAATSKLPVVARLPNTAVEADLTAANIAKVAGAAVWPYRGNYALESVAKRLTHPKLLVFATHGYFLPDQQLRTDPRATDSPAVGTRSATLLPDGKLMDNPLLRCGLLLASCNSPQATDGDDGVLTGLEIVGIDLRGTELVVLSACETGIGKVNNGEGVAGLRQAFQLAGANAVVSTLWQVPDRDSALIMNDFFAHLAEGQTKGDALRNAQLKRIEARREKNGAAHPFYWAAWTVTE